MTNETMPHWLAKRANLSPERIALQNDHAEMTFLELDLEARKMARKLAALNIKEGDNLAVLLKNDFSSIILIHALTYLGAVTVFLNTRLSPRELVFQIKTAQVKTLIYHADYQEITQQIDQELDKAKLEESQQSYLQKESKEIAVFEDELEKISIEELESLNEKEASLLSEVDLAKSHSLIFTSGTTGTPKAVDLSYGNHFWSALGSCLNIGLKMKDSWLLVLPIFHVSGLSVLMRSVIYGIKVLVHEEFNASRVNQDLLDKGVSHISLVSIQLQKMLDDLQEKTYPSSLRCVLLGGGFAPRNLLEASQKKSIPVFQTYGLTETASQIVTLSPEYLTSKLGSAGKALFPAQLKIMDKGQEVINKVGEILVKGPSVTSNYYNNEAATREALKEDWLYTGDLGYVDLEGFLYILDRRSDLIISGGENIYPAEIETVLLEHPKVEEAGVTGLKDERWGQVPIAFVKLKGKLEPAKVEAESIENKNDQAYLGFRGEDQETAKEIQEHCSSNLAKYKVPVKFICVDSLPRNASNKLIRHKLLESIKVNDNSSS